MALDAGFMHVTVEYGKDLRSRDWFSRQDPYCVLQCGTQKLRTKTAVNGAKDPVWNQTFQFQVLNENNLQITVYDEDTFTKDDTIGSTNVSFAKARQQGSDQINAPLATKHGKQQGFVSIRLRFESNDALRRQGQMGGQQYATYGAPAMYVIPPAPQYAQPPPAYPTYQQPAGYPAYQPAPQYPQAPQYYAAPAPTQMYGTAPPPAAPYPQYQQQPAMYPSYPQPAPAYPAYQQPGAYPVYQQPYGANPAYR